MFEDRTILITGASSGIGAALARRLAWEGPRLVLVARRVDRLAGLADELRGIEARPNVTTIVADLVEPGACERVVDEATATAGPVDVLVNNAGVGEYGRFAEKDPAAVERMMRLNMDAVVRLTHLVLPAMLERGRGWILNIASTAGFQPLPYMAVYGASKAFVLNFSMALWEEVRRQGVVVSCVCPGPVDTEFFDRGGYENRRREFTRLSMTARQVAETCYETLAKEKPLCIPGQANAFGTFIQRFLPLKMVTKLTGKFLTPR